jgi:hypothetical protein
MSVFLGTIRIVSDKKLSLAWDWDGTTKNCTATGTNKTWSRTSLIATDTVQYTGY